MAADLHIHVLEGCSVRDYARINRNTLGSRFCDFGKDSRNEIEAKFRGTEEEYAEWEKWTRFRDQLDNKATEKILDSPNFWIGEVSWLKAALSGDKEAFVPNPIEKIHDLVYEDFPILTEELLQKILAALDVPNTTGYRLVEKKDLEEKLRPHLGKQIFTVSW